MSNSIFDIFFNFILYFCQSQISSLKGLLAYLYLHFTSGFIFFLPQFSKFHFTSLVYLQKILVIIYYAIYNFETTG